MADPVKKTDKKPFGGKAGPGRPKGVPNKTTATIKEAIASVYAKLQDKQGGDHAHFLAWAEESPTEFYKLAAKLIPVQLTGEDGGPLQIVINKPA